MKPLGHACVVFVGPLGVLLASGAARAGQPREVPDALRQAVAWQLALERESISPGLIDGLIGPKTRLATRAFQRVRGLSETGELDPSTRSALRVDPARALGEHVVTNEDLALVGPTATEWTAKSRLKRLGYPSNMAAVAERFHCSKRLLQKLNPGMGKLEVGDRLTVPNIDEKPAARHAASLTIDMRKKTIRAADGDGKLVGLFHCSIAKHKDKRPTGRAKIVSITRDPTYTFDPKMWPEVHNVDSVLRIPPGPTNPVGLCWIGLSLQGYGIHGTPNPELIGKTGSHGCFRLTNWDALHLARMVQPGTPITFVN